MVCKGYSTPYSRAWPSNTLCDTEPAVCSASGIVEGERVFIVDINNGERFDTYVIAGEPRSGVICLNGAAARRVLPGDVVIIMAYALVTPEEARTFRPRVIFPDTATNRLPEQPHNNE